MFSGTIWQVSNNEDLDQLSLQNQELKSLRIFRGFVPMEIWKKVSKFYTFMTNFFFFFGYSHIFFLKEKVSGALINYFWTVDIVSVLFLNFNFCSYSKYQL